MIILTQFHIKEHILLIATVCHVMCDLIIISERLNAKYFLWIEIESEKKWREVKKKKKKNTWKNEY